MPRPHRLLVFTAPPTPPFARTLTRASHHLLSLAWTPPPRPSYLPISSSLRVVPVRGDGRCLYRAIAKGLASAEGRRLSENLERADADALRSMAWRAMCVDRAAEFSRRHVVEGKLSAYCRAMRSPTFYAGEAEILALSDVLKVPIRVYLQVGSGELRNIMTYGEKYVKGRKGSKDGGVRVLYSNGNHYDAILAR